MSEGMVELAGRIETFAFGLSVDTIEAAPGGTGNAAKAGLALYDLQRAVEAYTAAYAAHGDG